MEESALPEALETGWLRGAALDVFEVEPLPDPSPLWEDPRVMVSPHISGLTTTEGAVVGFLECLAAERTRRRRSSTRHSSRQSITAFTAPPVLRRGLFAFAHHTFNVPPGNAHSAPESS